MKKKKTISQTPKEKKTTIKPEGSLVTSDTKTPYKEGRLFYELGEDGDPTFASEEKLYLKLGGYSCFHFAVFHMLIVNLFFLLKNEYYIYEVKMLEGMKIFITLYMGTLRCS